MSESGRELSLRDYLRVVGRRKWLLIVAVVATVVPATVLSAVQDPIYEATAQMLVQTRQADTVFNNSTQTYVDPVRAVQTEIKVLESEPVATRVEKDLGLSTSVPDVTGTTDGATDVVSVAVRSGDATTARVLADAYVRAYIEIKREQAVGGLVSAGSELQKKVTELQGQINAFDLQIAAVPVGQPGGSTDLTAQRQVLVDQQTLFKQRIDQLQVDAALATGSAQVVRQADQPSSPVEPTPVRTGVLATVVGLLIGLGAVFLVDNFDDSIRTADDLERSLGISALAIVPVDRPPDQRPIAMSRPADFAVETYRSLRTSVQFLGLDESVRIIQITSPMSGEGKTTTASNLAVVFANAGHRVLLIDADLRRPRLHQVFGIDDGRGLTTALLGGFDASLLHTPLDNLDVLPAGPIPPNPSELVGGRRMRDLIQEMAGTYEYVIIDSAPVLPVSDSVGLAASCDGVLIVAQARRTSVRHVSKAMSLLERAQTPVLGIVLNRSGSKRRADDGYGYGYGYGSHEIPVATPKVDAGTSRVSEPTTVGARDL